MTSYVITGAGRGIGLEWIRQLSSASASNIVFAVVRNPSSSSQLQELASANPNVHVLVGDVSSPADMLSVAAAAAEITGGTLDVLVHNAMASPSDVAILSSGPSMLAPVNEELVARTKAEFELMWDTAVYATLWVTNAFLPLLEKAASAKGDAKVVHISTGLADIDFTLKSGIVYSIPYAAAKSAMNMLTAKYAVELRPRGIKVVSISPGWVETWPGESEFSFVVFIPSLVKERAELTVLKNRPRFLQQRRGC